MATQINDVEWASYSVSGQKLADVAASISQLPEAGQTTWPATFDYQADANGILTSATVTVRRVVTLPKWDGYSSASQAAKNEWDRFSAALSAHETGHSDLVVQNLQSLDQQMVGHSVSDARQIFNAALQTLKAASDAYDQQTNHGQNTGTVIDTSVDATTSNASDPNSVDGTTSNSSEPSSADQTTSNASDPNSVDGTTSNSAEPSSVDQTTSNTSDPNSADQTTSNVSDPNSPQP